MTKIPENYNIGDREAITVEKLLEMLEDMYQTLATSINQKPSVYTPQVGGVPTDADASNVTADVGDLSVNETTNKVEMATQRASVSTITWTTL